MFRTIDRDEARVRLRAAGWTRVVDASPGFEQWANRYGAEITLAPEHFGDYNEQAILLAEQMADERP